jgi:hypothetical protein
MSQDGTGVCDREWQLLEEHFRHHASIVNHFKDANAVRKLASTSRNSSVRRLSSVTASCLEGGQRIFPQPARNNCEPHALESANGYQLGTIGAIYALSSVRCCALRQGTLT